ncbi:hypothetical protein CTZ27_14900 [Streptomyces griseocarneus]|nr:hypothetical protein CTZ27_14900 [Streptomyces griseocarneus]
MTITPASAATTADRYAAPVDGSDGTMPIDVERIRQTIVTTLEPLPPGARLRPEGISATIALLTGHIGLLLPLAEAENRSRRPAPRSPGLIGYGLQFIRQQLTISPFLDPQADVDAAYARVQEKARHCRLLLGLVTADEAVAHWYAGETG